MKVDRKKLEQMVANIPKGRVTTHGILAAALGAPPRAVAQVVCKLDTPAQMRVVFQGGGFPHPKNSDDCRKRSKFLAAEGLTMSEDGLSVSVSKEDMWRP